MKRRPRRSTPSGTHLPVLLDATLAALAPKPGEVFADCTAGFGGHACALLRAVGPAGTVIAFDLDPANLARAAERLTAVGHPFEAHHLNFAGLAGALGGRMLDGLLADLGMSSMQVDDPGRGFSYRRDGPLDMRMDPTRGRTAAELLTSIDADELARALRELADEERAEHLAPRIVAAARAGELARTGDLTRLIEGVYGIKE
ncbi:MAG: 16S rRNA (cytosine(1402)-N(4))-methyltransferase, partial [Gemmataceae bacterium]